MNPNSLAILLIIAISAAVFGGIVFFGLRGAAPLPTGGPITTGTTVQIPDILNLPGFRGDRPQPANVPQPSPKRGPDVVVERSELPSPILPGTPASLQQSKFSTPMQIAPSRQTQPKSGSVFVPVLKPSSAPQPVPAPIPLPQTAAASFSVFSVSPQLKVFREQMVQEGIIGDRDFTRIDNNKDAEAFMLKLVEWQARKASSTPEQIQDALDRIKKAYGQIR